MTAENIKEYITLWLNITRMERIKQAFVVTEFGFKVTALQTFAALIMVRLKEKESKKKSH